MEVFGIAGLVLAALLGWQWYRRRSAIRSWSAVAAEHDLIFFEPGWFGEFSMSGTYDGVSVEVYTETRSTGKNSTTYTVYAASLPKRVPVDMVVHNEGMLSQVGKLFGGEDLEVGEPEVDDAFIFKTDHPTELLEFFDTPEVVDAFRNLARTDHSVQIEYGSIQIERRRLEPDRAPLERGLQVVTGFARDLADGPERGAEVSPAGEETAPSTGEDDGRPAGSENPSEDEEFAVEW